MYNNIFLTRHLPRLACLCRNAASIEGQKLPQSSSSQDGISPPPRIPRSPTDILEALAATVGPDPTAAHYKYHDDPYLIPLSNFRKRSYALSTEAGRKAAVWIRDQHADLFTTRVWDWPGKKITPHFNADPHIDAFAPQPIYTDESKVTEDDLKYTINNALMEDSIKVFQLLGGVENVSDELKLQFLELLCFYNEKEPDSAEWLEERWFSSNTRERQAATWRLGGLADSIFASMDPKTPEAYSAIIQGMAKYYQAERAHMLAQEAIENGITLSTDVFNALLNCIGFLKEGTALRVDALKSTLSQMEELGISPNQETLTSCLKSISAWGGGRVLQQLSMQLISEFTQLGIQPGLAAYYYLLCLFCKERGPRNDILTVMLDELEKRDKITPTQVADTNFFITAMGVCNEHLQNITLAERLHALLMKDDNYKLVGDAYKESIYYRHFVTVACRHAPFERTAELLDTLVPNVYVPEPSVMEEIIKTLEVAGSGDRLAQAWSQLIIFGLAKRVRLVEHLLRAMVNCYQYQDEEVKSKMRAAAADILKFTAMVDDEKDTKDLRSPPPKMSATALCNIIELCSNVKEKADSNWEVISEALIRMKREEARGVPSSPAVLVTLAENAATLGKPGIAATSVSYLAECGFEESAPASVKLLTIMLNRPESEVMELLKEPRAAIANNLHSSAVAIVEAYHVATTGSSLRSKEDSTSSSDSDSETSEDE